MRHLGLGCILLASAMGAQAASLGRHSGAAIIGLPLDIRVQTLLTPGEQTGGLCPTAEVFYGDSLVPPASVRTQLQPPQPNAEAFLRIQSSVAVNEPVVSLVVRVGCDAPFSRRYVLLADPLSDPVAAAAPQAAVRAPGETGSAMGPPVGLSPAPAVTAPAMTGTGMGRSAPVGAAAATGATQRAAPVARATARVAPAPGRTAPVPVPRLQLDPLDIRLEILGDPVLRLSDRLLSQPAATDEQRASAARLWQAINASPEDRLRDAQQLQVLVAEVNSLRDQLARDRAALAAAQADQQQSRQLTWWVYGLGFALFAALTGWLMFWRRQRQGVGQQPEHRVWWAAAGEKSSTPAPVDVPGESADEAATIAEPRREPTSAGELGQAPIASQPAPSMAAAPVRAVDERELLSGPIGMSRSMAAEELFDIQQKADFFVSLGDHARAVQVLKQHLAESQEPSPLAYLDLLKLYHRLDRRDDYEQLRQDFNRVLNADAPSFDHFSEDSRCLEDYSDALQRIQALWLQPRVLEVIEKSIFRDQADTEAEVFDLEAYRELLLLHAIAKDLIDRDGLLPDGPPDFEHTDIRPLQAAGSAADPHVGARSAGLLPDHTVPMGLRSRVSAPLALDIDLDALEPVQAEAAPGAAYAPSPVLTDPYPPPAGSAATADSSHLIEFETSDLRSPDESPPPR